MLDKTCLAFCWALLATPAAAADLALVIGNESYDHIPVLTGATRVVDAASALEDAGVEVIGVADGHLDETMASVRRFVQSAPQADRLLVVLASRFVSTATDAYLLPVDTEGPPLAALPAESLPLSVLFAVLGEAPGRSVMVLAEAPADADFGRYVGAGAGQVLPPQGVSLVRADPEAAARLVEEVLAVPGRALAEGAAGLPEVAVSGFLPVDYAFLPRRQQEAAAPDTVEAEVWQDARERDTAAAYEAYLDSYPTGKNAIEARLRIDELQRDPAARAQVAEEALALDLDARKQIQRDLSLLGHDTRGIDGIFGPGTRGAIRAWQEGESLTATGFLDAAQIDRLARGAVGRAEVLEREAERRRAERTREDREFWRRTGELRTEDGYRRYLQSYPDGIYAEVAQERVAEIEAQRRARAGAADRAAWQEARRKDNRAAYERYMRQFPQGAFAGEARRAIDGRSPQRRAESEAALATERALGLNPMTARLLEQRLDALGLRPGPVDGALDDDSRRAIRRYQGERDLPVTGYLNQPTVVRLLADSVRRALQ